MNDSRSLRENYLRNVSMTGPAWMPTHLVISGATWNQLGPELDAVLARHPVLFPHHVPGGRAVREANACGLVETHNVTVDAWGCVWEQQLEGMVGLVTGHPLADWASLPQLRIPDPAREGDMGALDWDEVARRFADCRAREDVAAGDLDHGFLFMRLYYLRGFEELMLDYASDEPKLRDLIDILVRFNRERVRRYVALGADVITAGDDLGTQTAAMISPAMFRAWITPAYQQIFAPAREAGRHVFLHSDGHMIELIDEIIAAGVTICNPQDLCNGIDEIKAAVDGRIAVCLDVDRQRIVPFGAPGEIRDLIEEGVRKLGSPRGGLELIAGIYPPTPAENVDAVLSAFEEFRTYWFDGRGTRAEARAARR